MSDDRLYIPALRPLYAALDPLVWPLIRIVVGLFLMPHGAQKLFGWFGGDSQAMADFFAKIGLEPAMPLVIATGVVEFFGGLLIAVGLFTRPAAVAAAVMLLVATVKVHLGNGFFWTSMGSEYPLMWAILAAAIAVKGGGRLSVDGRIGREF
jgi:putative oxidoreductase